MMKFTLLLLSKIVIYNAIALGFDIMGVSIDEDKERIEKIRLRALADTKKGPFLTQSHIPQ